MLHLILPALASAALATGPSQGSFDVAVREVHATACANVCTNMDVKFEFKNKSGVLYCVPGEYLSDKLSESVVVVEKNGDVRHYQDVPLTLRPVNDNSIERYSSSPMLVVRPGKAIVWTTIINNKFSFKKSPANITAQLYVFPCNARILPKEEAVGRTLTAKILYN